MTATKPKVAIVLVNWNELHHTLPCLESLAGLQYPNVWTIVVDNGSTDNSVEVIRREHPQVTRIPLKENMGFTGGNNAGMECALDGRADYVLLLNNDTLVAPDVIDLLVEAVEADPAVGVAGPTIYYHEDPERIWSAGGAIDWRRGDAHMLSVNEIDRGQLGETPRRVDFVTGCALFVDQAVLRRVGLLDPRFFIYYEETEWCARASKAGVGIVHVPKAKIWHKISLTQREASPGVHYYMTRNRLLFLHYSGAGAMAWAHLTLEYVRTLASWSLRRKWRHKRPQRDAMLQAVGDFFRGRLGKAQLSTK